MNKNLKNWCHWVRISAAILPLSLASLAASAGIIDVGFTTTGTGTWGPSCGMSCTDLTLSGNTVTNGLDGYFGKSGAPDFSFSGLLNVYGGLAPTGNWQLQDGSGDSLYGSTAGLLGGGPGGISLLLGFDITGGTGLFQDVTGVGGWSFGGVSWNGAFGNSGVLVVDGSPSTAVTEPGALLLLVFGLAGLGWTLRRRRVTLSGQGSRA